MFSSSFNEKKFTVNLRLAIQRLKLIENKKTQLALRSRKEIAQYLAADQIDRAKIKVEHIIREDYFVEALEIVEINLDLLLARVTMISNAKDKPVALVPVSVQQAVESVIWAYDRVASECPELKIIMEQLTIKFGPKYVHKVKNDDNNENVYKKLRSRLDPHGPKEYIVEKYLEMISTSFKGNYTADEEVMRKHEMQKAMHQEDLINMNQNEQGTSAGLYPNHPWNHAPSMNSNVNPGGQIQGTNFNNMMQSPVNTGYGGIPLNFRDQSNDDAPTNSNLAENEYQAPENVTPYPTDNCKAKEAESQQPYTGPNYSNTTMVPPPNYTDYNENTQIGGYSLPPQAKDVETKNDIPFIQPDLDELAAFELPSVPTTFLGGGGNNNGGNNNGNNGGGGGNLYDPVSPNNMPSAPKDQNFDDLEARFKSLRGSQ